MFALYWKKLLLVIALVLPLIVFNKTVSSAGQISIAGTPYPAITKTEADPYEPNDSLATATEISYGAGWGYGISAAIDEHDSVEWYDDVDFYRFSGRVGDKIVVDVTSSGTPDPSLTLLDAGGNIVDAEITDSFDQVHLEHTLDRAGSYFLHMQPDLYEGAYGGPYTLRLDVFDSFEPNDELAAAAPFDYGGGSILARIGAHDDVEFYDDVDFFQFNGYEGDEARVNLLPFGNLSPVVTLVDANGNLILRTGSDYEEATAFTYRLPTSGDYNLKIEGSCFEGGAGCDGPFRLSLDIVDRYEPNNFLETATPVKFFEPVLATLHNSDQDFYHFDGGKDDFVTIDVEVNGQYLNPDCSLWDASGEILLDDPDCSIEYSLPEAGSYFLGIYGQCEEYAWSCRGSYTLAVAAEQEVYLPFTTGN
jgi:hypothetical protein